MKKYSHAQRRLVSFSYLIEFLDVCKLLWFTKNFSAAAFAPKQYLVSSPSRRRISSAATSSGLTSLRFTPKILTLDSCWENVQKYASTVVIGKKASMEAILPKLLQPMGLQKSLPPSILNAMLSSLDAIKGGSSTTLVSLEDGNNNNDNNSIVHKVSLAGLSTKISRNNHPMAVHSITQLARTSAATDGDTRIIVLTDNHPIGPLACAIAKAFPLFSQKTTKKDAKKKDRNVHVVFCAADGSLIEDTQQLNAAQAVAAGIQLAARLVDSPPDLMTTTQFAKEVEALVQSPITNPNNKVRMTQLVGEELKSYGGLYAVGKGAVCPPRLVILEYDGRTNPQDETVALVGKGIVYDTGGLSLKAKDALPGMKYDMGGAAGVLGGFWSAVHLGVSKKVVAILCIADNAVSADAFRPDDVITMYSGKTVEVNNCDAVSG